MLFRALNAMERNTASVPVMATEEENGLYGPGHNSFTVDEEGRDLPVFHARPHPGFHGTALSGPHRHCFLRPVRCGTDGKPIFHDFAEGEWTL